MLPTWAPEHASVSTSRLVPPPSINRFQEDCVDFLALVNLLGHGPSRPWVGRSAARTALAGQCRAIQKVHVTLGRSSSRRNGLSWRAAPRRRLGHSNWPTCHGRFNRMRSCDRRRRGLRVYPPVRLKSEFSGGVNPGGQIGGYAGSHLTPCQLTSSKLAPTKLTSATLTSSRLAPAKFASTN